MCAETVTPATPRRPRGDLGHPRERMPGPRRGSSPRGTKPFQKPWTSSRGWPMAESKISRPLAQTLVRGWSGLEKYPFHPEGEARLIEYLMAYSISVPHARAVVAKFELQCP